MAGVPLTLGFVAKESAYEALLHGGQWPTWLLALTVLTSVLLGLAGLLAGVSPFRGAPGPGPNGHEPSWPLWMPPLVLAVGGGLFGIVPSMLDGPFSAAAGAILGTSAGVSLSVWHGLTPPLTLSVLTLLGVWAAYVLRDVIRRRAWRPAHGAEQLYTGALAALDAISRTIAPALHSAPLRSYVMVIVVTTMVVGGAALLTASGGRALGPAMNVLVHEMLIVLIVIAGALAATLAKSTMAAVLSCSGISGISGRSRRGSSATVTPASPSGSGRSSARWCSRSPDRKRLRACGSTSWSTVPRSGTVATSST
jgi:multicomponent Na+:H+ antiporter subunit A